MTAGLGFLHGLPQRHGRAASIFGGDWKLLPVQLVSDGCESGRGRGRSPYMTHNYLSDCHLRVYDHRHGQQRYEYLPQFGRQNAQDLMTSWRVSKNSGDNLAQNDAVQITGQADSRHN